MRPPRLALHASQWRFQRMGVLPLAAPCRPNAPAPRTPKVKARTVNHRSPGGRKTVWRNPRIRRGARSYSHAPRVWFAGNWFPSRSAGIVALVVGSTRHSPLTGGSTTHLSVTNAWRSAPVGDELKLHQVYQNVHS